MHVSSNAFTLSSSAFILVSKRSLRARTGLAPSIMINSTRQATTAILHWLAISVEDIFPWWNIKSWQAWKYKICLILNNSGAVLQTYITVFMEIVLYWKEKDAGDLLENPWLFQSQNSYSFSFFLYLHFTDITINLQIYEWIKSL